MIVHTKGFSPFVFLVCVLCCLQPILAVTPDADDEHLRRLCEHGLTESAIAYCQARLAASNDKPGEIARWTMRRMESEAQAALRLTGKADQHWAAAKQLLAIFQQQRADDLRLPWLRWQVARNDLLKSQAALAAWLAAPAMTSMREESLTTVREIESELDKLDADIEHRLPLAAKQQVGRETQAPADQLLQLRVESSLLRCEAMLVRGQCYKSGSRDRIAAATNVNSIAEANLARVPPDWPARGSLLAARAIAGLELGQRSDALRELQRLANQAAPPLVLARVSAAIVDALIEDGEFDSARTWVGKLEASRDGPDTQLARLRLRLAEISKLNGEGRQQALQQLIDLAKSIGELYGDYWRRRADAILVASIAELANSPGSTSIGIELVLTETRQLLAAGNHSMAISKLIDATQTAKAAGEFAQAIELASHAYALLLKQSEWTRAADILLPLTAELATASGASEAHWLATRGLVQSLKAQSSNDELRKLYEDSLIEQIRLWPDSKESEFAIQWLEKWLLAQSRGTALLSVLQDRAIASTNQETIANTLLLWLSILAERVPDKEAATHRLWLAQLLRDSKFAAAGSTAEVASIASFVFTQWPTREQRAQMATLVRSAASHALTDVDAQILLSVRILDAARTGELNSAIELGRSWNPHVLPSRLIRAWATQFVAAVDQRPFDEHVRWMPIAKKLPPWQELLSENPSIQFIATGTRISAWEGKHDSSRSEMKSLLEKQPQNGLLRLQFAQLTAEAGTTAYSEALRLAQQVATGADKTSELFLNARWLEIRVLLASGESAKAQKIAAQMLLTQEFESDIWLERFNSMAK